MTRFESDLSVGPCHIDGRRPLKKALEGRGVGGNWWNHAPDEVIPPDEAMGSAVGVMAWLKL